MSATLNKLKIRKPRKTNSHSFFVDMDEDESFLDTLGEIACEPSVKRSTCPRCRRPTSVCWCAYLPDTRIKVQTKVTILQHPFEESRCLRTAPMIELGLEVGHCNILKGKRFNLSQHPELQALVKDPNTVVMYPDKDAINISELPALGDGQHYNLILLDGTWHQAKSIYSQNAFLRPLRQVQLKHTGLSEYVIRTQPTDSSLSTVETAVFAIAALENSPDIVDPLLRPLRALCHFQMQHGAVKHQSKQYLIENGLYETELPSNRKNTVLQKRLQAQRDTNQTGLAPDGNALSDNSLEQSNSMEYSEERSSISVKETGHENLNCSEQNDNGS